MSGREAVAQHVLNRALPGVVHLDHDIGLQQRRMRDGVDDLHLGPFDIAEDE